MDETEWVPRRHDIEWMLRMIATLKQDGVWGNSSGTYKFDHRKREVARIVAADPNSYVPDMDMTAGELHRRIVKVLHLVDWTFVDHASGKEEAQ